MADEITGNTNVKLESCFLGSVDVPFTTIYLNGNINGTFEVEVPKVNLGYLYERVGMADKSHPFSPDRTVATHATASNPTAGLDARTFLYLLISVDPPLPLPSEPTVPPPRGENRRLLTYARRWEAKYKRNGAQALVMNSAVRRSACGEALVEAHTPPWLCLCGLVCGLACLRVWLGWCGQQGEWVLMNRYLRPQQPPPDEIVYDLHRSPTQQEQIMMQQPMETPEKVARFVSLIPFLPDWETFVGDTGTALYCERGCAAMLTCACRTDLWCTSQEFLDLGYGDWEEHAVLLANYFMYLSQDRWETMLLLGQAIPEGDTIYVVRRFNISGKIELWNAAKVWLVTTTD